MFETKRKCVEGDEGQVKEKNSLYMFFMIFYGAISMESATYETFRNEESINIGIKYFTL